MRVEITHDLADDLRALAISPRRREPHRLHAVENTAVGWLETVSGVWQRSSDDHAHGVIHVRTLHLVFDIDGVLTGSEVGHK